MRVLIIDNHIDPTCFGAEALKKQVLKFPGVTVYVRRGPEDDLPKNLTGFDKIIISGSKTSVLEVAPWIQHLEDWIKKALNARKPLLGVCYGHQILVRTLVGAKGVRKSSNPEFGWNKIQILTPSPLLQGLSQNFHVFSAHFDEVACLPERSKHLARSERCEIQAFELLDAPAYGIQFHPETELSDGTKVLEERGKTGEPKTLLHPKDGQKLFSPHVGETLFSNFLKL